MEQRLLSRYEETNKAVEVKVSVVGGNRIYIGVHFPGSLYFLFAASIHERNSGESQHS